MKEELKSGIEEFDLLVERFENGEITFVELTSALWNKGFNAGYHHQALSQHDVISRRELLLDFAEYSENDKTSTAIDECVDNYLDSIKQ